MRVESSRKGTYLVVMAVAAFSFVVYLFVAPSFSADSHPVPPLAFGITIGLLALVSVALWVWRQRLKATTPPLNREEGKVSGQTEAMPVDRNSR